ncbi:MAG: diguanylate cyclase, partial [Lachnospiraceae bacterium]|nr:diguanylate cyclase [Lachnospiraceae bacterium]
IICGVFANSTVFRIGGDEFAVIAMESDYDSVDRLMDRIAKINKKNSASGDVVIACGMSRFDNDRKVSTVFERADNLMYKNKNKLKTDMQKDSTKK